MVIITIVGVLLVFCYHALATSFHWLPKYPFVFTGVLFLVVIATQFANRASPLLAASVVVSYQFLLYFLARLCFIKFEKRELQDKFLEVGVDRRYYVDWNYWAVWMALAVAPPIFLEDWFPVLTDS